MKTQYYQVSSFGETRDVHFQVSGKLLKEMQNTPMEAGWSFVEIENDRKLREPTMKTCRTLKSAMKQLERAK